MIEDLHLNYKTSYGGGNNATMVEDIKLLIQSKLENKPYGLKFADGTVAAPTIKSIDCFSKMCIFTKV